jgi:hypothetical protein
MLNATFDRMRSSKSSLWFRIGLGLSCLAASPAWADCDVFIDQVSEAVDLYQANHRVHPVDAETRALAIEWTPKLWVSPGSYRPVDFDAYLENARLYAEEDGRVLADSAVGEAIRRMDRPQQCRSYLASAELPPADPAPIYIQVFEDVGPNGEDGWLYLKYTIVFDWSGLARERSLLSRVGSLLTGGDPERWHRLDVHTAAILGLDARRRLRTLTLQQHNNQRTHVARLDFDPTDGLHLAAAHGTNELYLDTGSAEPQRRRAVPSFLQWPHLIDASESSALSQVDEFVGRNAGGQPTRLRPVFLAPGSPLASYAGLLAPKRRMLGFYVGRDGPPGFDFTGTPEMPQAAAIGYWHEGDRDFLAVLDVHLDGFQSTRWEAIREYLAARLGEALRRTDQD